MKRYRVELKVVLLIDAKKKADMDDVVNELEYNFSDTTDKASVYDSTIEDYEYRELL